MELAELERELIAAARANPPSASVPYAFEKRILARISASPGMDSWAQWSRALWKAAAPCFAIMILLAAWSFAAPAVNSPAGDLSQEFENTVLAAIDQEQAADPSW